MFSLETIKGNITTVDRQLLLMIYEELHEMNCLLGQLVNENKPVTDEHTDLESLKRPELMKRMSKLGNAPQGWNRWETEQIRKHLREVG
jgi:hypothetical protein